MHSNGFFMPTLHSINPATGSILETYTLHSREEANEAIERAHRAYLPWSKTAIAERAVLMKALGVKLRAEKEALARLAAAEMGKVLREGIAEVEKCASACEYFADHADDFLNDHAIATEWRKSYAAFRPLGWCWRSCRRNFPFWQVLRAAIPAMMAGNAVVLKHASNVPACALMIEKLMAQAGFPAGLFTTLLIPGKKRAR